MGGEDYLDDTAPETVGSVLLQRHTTAENTLRAYSYWADPSGSLGSFEEFSQGYADTTSVEVSLGSIGADAGMSQVYYSVPALLTAHTGDGAPQTYAACYVIHFTQPGVLGQPPFYPMRFLKGDARLLDSGEDAQPALAQACADLGFPAGNPLPPIATTAPDDIGVNAYTTTAAARWRCCNLCSMPSTVTNPSGRIPTGKSPACLTRPSGMVMPRRLRYSCAPGR